jgi:hypothetical protein
VRPNYGFALYPTADTGEGDSTGASVDVLDSCTLTVTYEPRDRSRDKCLAPTIVTIGTGVDVYGAGGSDDDVYVQLVADDGARSAEISVSDYFAEGDKIATAALVECNLGTLAGVSLRLEGVDALCLTEVTE